MLDVRETIFKRRGLFVKQGARLQVNGNFTKRRRFVCQGHDRLLTIPFGSFRIWT